MWTCPKCKENLEDQFDSCWKCAGSGQASNQTTDLAWMYPLISLASISVLYLLGGSFWRQSHTNAGYFNSYGVLLSLVTGSICLWTFFKCPIRHWFAKLLTLMMLVSALFY